MAYWTTYKRNPHSLEAPGEWETVSDEAAQAVWSQIPRLQRTALPQIEDLAYRVLRISLPFYPGQHLYEFVNLELTPELPCYVLVGQGVVRTLDWSNSTILTLGLLGSFRINEDTVIDYVRFFCAHVAGRYGRFLLLESTDIPTRDGFTDEHAGLLNKHVMPLTPAQLVRDGDTFHFPAMIRFRGGIARAKVSVTLAGQVDFELDEFVLEKFPLVEDRPTDADYPGKPVFDFRAGWIPLDGLDTALRKQLAGLENFAGTPAGDALTYQPLSFFTDVILLRILAEKPGTGFGMYALWSAKGLFPLNGRATPIYEAIEREQLVLDDDTVTDYMQFFCTFVHAEQGPFRVVNRPEELNVTDPKHDREMPVYVDQCPQQYEQLSGDSLKSLICPVARHADEGKRQWRFSSLNQYGDHLFRSSFTLKPDGVMEMTDDVVIISDIPIDPKRNRMQQVSVTAPTSGNDGVKPDDMAALIRKTSQVSKWPGYLNERELEASILGECVRLQLLHALRAGQAAPLFETDQAADDESLLQAFADFICRLYPVMVLESSIPFIERIAGDLLEQRTGNLRFLSNVETAPTDMLKCIIPDLEDNCLLKVSLHQYRGILRPEAVVYQLGVTDAALLIGCDTAAIVPAAIQRVMDVKLTLGAIEPGQFRILFCALLDCEWPDVDEDSPLWQSYVTPGDFYQPVRDMLQRRYLSTGDADQAESPWTAADALVAIRERVTGRLTEIEVDDGPGLEDLHGLDEAKAVLRDLLVDIHAAVAGEIPWSDVDRGMLLTGEPGTGKTLLARALARDCGLRFIQASAASWIAGTDNLGDHLRAMQATFAEARRNAPCILFIDELDSIGNRERFEGRNRDYCTQVVDALLQELQGVVDREGLFVIGVTNHVHNIDPALTRAGRLDQIVPVLRPDRHALVEILRLYLKPHVAENNLAADVDEQALAGMALGATGADIEFFVRDAARRARKESTSISHRHLAAAITRAPRSAATTRIVSPQEQARTAVHEAGHAIAMLLCKHYAVRVNMVSIIPRSDGSLGFTGGMPDDRHYLTRRACMEYLEVMLAGRAAEELVYSKENISGGAGGSNESSDLAIAMRWAGHMACRLGFGPAGQLRWQEQPGAVQSIGEIQDLLEQAYRQIREKLARHENMLHALRDALLDRHELFETELKQLAAAHGLQVENRGVAQASRPEGAA